MRPIKFRAWDGKQMRAVRLERVRQAYDGDLSFTDGEIDHGEYHDLDHFPLMQYTGLKDKNGVEIYEGDVVHCDSETHNCNLVVKFGCYAFAGHSHHGWYLETTEGAFEWAIRQIDLDAGDYTVIGNIHESPELLEATNG